ncbi:MAG: BatD family protein, partial [bacterium]
MRRVQSVLFVIAFIAVRGLAQDASFVATLDKNPVSVNDQFTLSFTLQNAGSGGGKNLKLPNLDNFRIMMGPSTTSNMQYINGVVSSSFTYSYVLQPKSVGKFTIGAASIEIGGKTYSSPALTIEVSKSTVQSNKQQQQQGGVSGDVEAQLAENLLLRATIDKSRVVQGQQINLVYKLYTRVQIQNYNLTKSPTMTGFWSEDVEMAKQIQLATETYNGKQFQVGVIKRSALFPTQSGTLEIGPMEITTLVTVRDKRTWDPFDVFNGNPFGRQIEYVVKSEPIRIKVDPLPPGAPASFKGAVGKFSISAKVDKQNAKTNEPISYKVVIAGTGNIKVLESPSIEVPTDFEQYTPKVADNINRRDVRISGSKTFEYILVPRYPGKKIIKPVEFSYFDLGKNEYVTLKSPQLEINVEQGPAGATPFVSSSPREDVQMLSQDIRFIKVDRPAFVKRGEYLYTSGAFIALLLLPLAGLGGTLVYTRKRQAVMSDMVGYRNRRAIKVARKGLKNAEVLLKEVSGGNDNAERKIAFYSEVARAMWKYLGDKLNIQQADISIELAVNELSVRSV